MDCYLCIDTEVGGANFMSGKDSILEVAMIPIPDPNKSEYTQAEFMKHFLDGRRMRYFMIKPYSNVDSYILDKVLKHDISYYRAAMDVAQASKRIEHVISRLAQSYERVIPVSDWHGDINAIDYLLSLHGTSFYKITRQHNMLHLKSFIQGMLPEGMNYESYKREIGVRKLLRGEAHQANNDCIYISVPIRYGYYPLIRLCKS